MVEGHRERTLDILRQLVTHGTMEELAPAAAVKREVERARRLGRRLGGRSLSDARVAAAGAGDVSDRLLAWLQAVCAISRVRVHNLGSSLRDFVALCLLIRHYVPGLIADENLKLQERDGSQDDEMAELQACGWLREGREGAGEAVAIVEARQKAFSNALQSVGCVPVLLGASDMLGCGPEDHVASVMLAYLFARLTDLTRQFRAAEMLQVDDSK